MSYNPFNNEQPSVYKREPHFFFFSQQRMRKTNSGGCKMLDLPTNRDESERYISLTIQVKRQHKLILDDPLCLIQPNPILKMANNTRHFARRTRKKPFFFLIFQRENCDQIGAWKFTLQLLPSFTQIFFCFCPLTASSWRLIQTYPTEIFLSYSPVVEFVL